MFGMRLALVALCVALASIAASCAVMRYDAFVGEYQRWSPRQLERTLGAIKDANDLTVEVFFLPDREAPVQRVPPDPIESWPASQLWHRVIEDGAVVEKLAATASALRIADGDEFGFATNLKLTFRRYGRVVLELEFRVGSLANHRREAVTPALIDGRPALVNFEPVDLLFTFAEQESGMGRYDGPILR
jgi:hypothetical protein